MKIKEFAITRYGPLPDRGRIPLADFNLLWGRNEFGKTLTIDALVKVLLGKKTKAFETINRVDEIPEGYVILIDESGGEIKLPEGGTLTELADLNASECRNVFIVINSDLSIARDLAGESDFYTSVTDRLTGLRSGKIFNIKKNLEGIGKITRTGKFKDVEGEKQKTRISNVEGLLEEVDILTDEIGKKGFDEFEQESVRLGEERSRIEEEILKLEDARKREKYEKAKEALDELRNALKELGSLKGYNEDDEQLWRDHEKEIEDYTRKKENLFLELGEIKKEFEEKREDSANKERDFQILEDRKRKLDDEILPQLENYKERRENFVKREEEKGFISTFFLISSLLFGLSFLGMILNPSLLFYIFAAVFLTSFVTSGIIKYRIVREKGALTKRFESFKMVLSQFGLDAEDLPGAILNMQNFNEEYRRKNDQLQEIKWKKKNLEENLNNLQEKKIPEIGKEIKEAENAITKLKTQSKEESLKSYSGKLESKLKIEGSIEKKESVLTSLFNTESDDLEKNIFYWDKETEDLESYKSKARNKVYSESDNMKLKKKKGELGEKYEEISKNMKNTQDKLKDVERKVNKILRLEDDYLLCTTSIDLKVVKDELHRFITQSNKNRDDVMEIIAIFEEIDREEKEKVSELFGKESPVSKYFKEITGGFYDEVIFNREAESIEVRRKDGEMLKAEKLSGGAYDQLYFSIRIALGEKLLKGKKGFFILDDPFIKADPDRLRRQMETLKSISKNGWQILYFSSKGEIKNLLEKEIENNTVNYIEIQDIFS